MPPSQTSQPHLPRKLVLDLLKESWMTNFKSTVFTSTGHRLRFGIANYWADTAISAETLIRGHFGGFFLTLDEERAKETERDSLTVRSKGSNTKTNRKSSKRVESPARYAEYTVLNKSIDDTDPLLASETIRLGALINTVNGRGQTPLLQTLERLYDAEGVYTWAKKSGEFPWHMVQTKFRSDLDKGKARLKYIAILLIEQHADVNATMEWQGKMVTPLYLATCVVRDFDIVARLLMHGANPSPSSPAASIREAFSGNDSERDLLRFDQLVSEIPYGPGTPRPPRVCPCFSGKSLPECHDNGVDHPYPDEFLCGCASKKPYGQCCKLRNMETVEVWNEEGKWIEPRRVIALPRDMPSHIGPETQQTMAEFGVDGKIMDELVAKYNKDAAMLICDPRFRESSGELIEMACKEDERVDPAFAWTYLQLRFFPSPQGRSTSKKWCLTKQREWNLTVDKYIALGTDARSKLDIECAAKIGHSLGPLHKTCEAVGCGKVEGKDVKKLLTCSKCQMSYYCSPDCQKLSWKEHKKLCGTGVHQGEAPLPSQTVIEDFVLKRLAPMIMTEPSATDMEWFVGMMKAPPQ
ncbi:hypothetical protein BDP27DRAFT_1429141 [Rhodocollybia butyracea]|uniref:MYND-type domain-containing protein n=1 Tax=Rhodocollybia butyracea TaxID=206335 RepID=A0A9P5PEK6_9AGAR|nr:hypothetical protein BDP27DRAFT_1429141 [Rhodocollybia butyracea]